MDGDVPIIYAVIVLASTSSIILACSILSMLFLYPAKTRVTTYKLTTLAVMLSVFSGVLYLASISTIVGSLNLGLFVVLSVALSFFIKWFCHVAKKYNKLRHNRPQAGWTNHYVVRLCARRYGSWRSK